MEYLDYFKYVETIAFNYYKSHKNVFIANYLSVQDIKQEAHTKAWQTFIKYKNKVTPERLKNYFSREIKTHLIRLTQKSMKHNKYIMPINSRRGDNNDEFISSLSKSMQKYNNEAKVNIFLKEFKKVCTPIQWKVFYGKVKLAKNFNELAKELSTKDKNYTPQAIHKIYKKLLSILNKKLVFLKFMTIL